MSVSNILESASFTTTGAIAGFPVNVQFSYERVDHHVTVSIRNTGDEYSLSNAGMNITADQLGNVGTLLARDGGLIGRTITFFVPVSYGDHEFISSGFVTLSRTGALHVKRVKYITGASPNAEATPDALQEMNAGPAGNSRLYNCSFSYVLPISRNL